MSDIVQARWVWEVYLDLQVQNHSSEFPVILVATQELAEKVAKLVDDGVDEFESVLDFGNEDLGLPFTVEYRRKLVPATDPDVAVSVFEAKEDVKKWLDEVSTVSDNSEDLGDETMSERAEGLYFSDN